jgi:hypothetical protein
VTIRLPLKKGAPVEWQVREKLVRSAGDGAMVGVTRGFPGDPSIHGFVVAVGEELVLMHQFHDFYSEGFTAIRLQDIECVESGRRDDVIRDIINYEKLAEHPPPQCGLDLSSMLAFIRSLVGRYQLVVLECESRTWCEEDEYYLGRLLSADENGVVVRCVDPVGAIDRDTTSVCHDDVTKVQFDTPYINLFARYVERQKGQSRRGD